MTWDEFLVRRENFIGQDMLTDEGVGYCRGPIEYVVGEGDTVRFRLKWMAKSSDLKNWTLLEAPAHLSARMDIASVRDCCDSVIIDIPYLGSFKILPEGDHLAKEDCEMTW